MASYLLHISYILVSFSLLFVLFDPSFAKVSVKITKVLLKQLCSTTDDPNLCVNILSSDPRTDTADLQGLLSVSINLGLATATENNNYISSVLRNTTNPEQKRCLGICSDDYNGIVGLLNTAVDYFTEHNYNEVTRCAGGSGNTVIHCLNLLKAPPPIEPTLTQKSWVVDVLSDLMITISSQLAS